MAVLDFKAIVALTLIASSAGAIPVQAQGPIGEEYQVKAAFLANFAKFVEWPQGAFKSSQDPVAICVFGQNPFGFWLEDDARGKSAGGRSIVVREVSKVQEANGCQILFFRPSEQKRVPALLDDLKAYSILTVGETDDFLTNGGIVNLRLKDARVRIEINPKAAERARLRIGSQLLGLADLVKK